VAKNKRGADVGVQCSVFTVKLYTDVLVQDTEHVGVLVFCTRNT
jgi:hypothetical protein